MILLEGILVGLVTGIVGAGGGFLIIPALVILAKLPMKMAVGTSLLIMVGVAIDTMQQVNSYLLNRHYDGLMKTGKNRKAVA